MHVNLQVQFIHRYPQVLFIQIYITFISWSHIRQPATLKNIDCIQWMGIISPQCLLQVDGAMWIVWTIFLKVWWLLQYNCLLQMKISREVARRFTRSTLKLILEIKITWREDLRYEWAKQKRRQVAIAKWRKKRKYNHHYPTLLIVQTCYSDLFSNVHRTWWLSLTKFLKDMLTAE